MIALLDLLLASLELVVLGDGPAFLLERLDDLRPGPKSKTN
jgi:hypothetical protein